MARDDITRIWDNDDNPIGGMHDRVQFALGNPDDNQFITVIMEGDHLIIRGVAARPALIIEPQVSNAIKVTFRDMEPTG